MISLFKGFANALQLEMAGYEPLRDFNAEYHVQELFTMTMYHFQLSGDAPHLELSHMWKEIAKRLWEDLLEGELISLPREIPRIIRGELSGEAPDHRCYYLQLGMMAALLAEQLAE